MKRLFLILLLTFTIPSIHSTGQEKSKKELANEEKERAKAKKDAIKKLKNLLILTYRNWYWDGSVVKDEIDETYSIDLFSGDYFFLILVLSPEKNNLAISVVLYLPESYVPNYEGKENGPKTLKIQARFEGGEKFETVLESDGNPQRWYFAPKEVKDAQGKMINPLNEMFFNKKLFIQFQTNLRSRYQGEYKIISFDISGVEEIYKAAYPILIN